MWVQLGPVYTRRRISDLAPVLQLWIRIVYRAWMRARVCDPRQSSLINISHSISKTTQRANARKGKEIVRVLCALATTLRNEGWVPGVFKGWLALPWLGFPTTQQWAPPARRLGSRHTDKRREKLGGEGRGGGAIQLGEAVQPWDLRTTWACAHATYRRLLLPLKDNRAANLYRSLLLTLLSCI